MNKNPRLPSMLLRATVSAAYPLFILAMGTERGLDEDCLLMHSGLSRALLTAPDARVTIVQYGQVVSNLLRRSQDPALGIELGMRSNLTKIGMIGFGLMSCNTLREAITLGLRFIPLRVPYFNVSFIQDGDTGIIDIREALPLGMHRQFAFEYLMVELRYIYLSLMIPGRLPQFEDASEMWFMHSEPEYFAAYRNHLPRCHFDKPAYQLRFDARKLDVPILTASPEMVRQVINHCERELALLGVVDLPARIRALLICGDEGYPSVEMIASKIHMSERTLKRKLHEHGLSYSTLLTEVRRRDAQQLLTLPGMTVSEVAARVGYTNRVNFSRAFRLWTGLTPSDYQQRHLAPVNNGPE
jgi:AraC-like DNA-binding protein